MIFRRNWIWAALAVVFLFQSNLPLSADPQQPLPTIKSYVVDQTDTLTVAQKDDITGILERIESANGSQVVLVIVETTKPESIEQYSIRLAESAGIGRQDSDDGVLLLVAKADRRVRIEVGYGLEGNIPDATANRIIDTKIIPEFKKGNFYLGLKNGVLAIEEKIAAEPVGDSSSDDNYEESSSSAGDFWLYLFYDFIHYWFWIVYGIAAILGWIAAKTKKYTLYLIWALLIGVHPPAFWVFMEGFFFFEPFLWRFFISLFAFHIPFWLAGGRPPPSSGRRSRSSGSSSSYSPSFSSFSSSSSSSRSSSSSSSSSYSSSSSSSSFSGGGGSFGGGGASGSW